ncbi:hypothetical protein BC826DRAFT_301206 [Russula brevipes]|nr:hypothetical protein BC826DRAFT_301206 [Russula brevipes]
MFAFKQLLSLSVLSTFLTLASAQPALPPTCPGATRVVQSGDTCQSIADAASMAVTTLQAINPDIDCTHLSNGQVLCLTGTPKPPTCQCTTTRVVQSGDTCQTIADAASMAVSTLQAINPGLDCTNLFNGEVLCIACTTKCRCSSSHVVRAGDTCDSIANAASTAVSTLKANNPGLDCANLFIGENLCTDFRVLSTC